jgi:glycosyltransferase involved in cell wall biosynthesis
MPKVTVLMAVYNGERYLRESIESILAQAFEDFEFLIINDGSTDSTREVILSHHDPRIRLVDNDRNLGLARSLNRGLEVAEGEYIARQDVDDISEPERLAKQVIFLDSHPDVALLGTWYRELDSQGNFIKKRTLPCDYTEIRWSLLFYCPFAHSAVMLRRSAVLGQIGSYNEALTYSLDYELWLRIARRMRVGNLNEYLVTYRISPSTMTSTYGDRTREGVRIRIRNVAHLLGWDETNAARNEAQFSKMAALLFGPYTNLVPQEVNSVSKEILRLHDAFCQSYDIELRDCIIHRAKLRSQLSRRLLEMALAYFDQNDAAVARQLRSSAHRLDRRALLTKNYMWLFFKLLLGFRYVQALKRLAP